MTIQTTQAQATKPRIGPGCVMRRLRVGLATLLRAIAPVQVPEDLAERIFRDRSRVLADIFKVMSIVGMLIIGLLALYFRNNSGSDLLDVLFVASIADYLLLFRKSVNWGRGRRPCNPRRFTQEMFILLICQGSIWASLAVVMMHVATISQIGLVYAVVVAGMATAVLVAPISISLAFWAPVAAGANTALFCTTTVPFDPYAFLCLLGFTLLTGYATVYLNNRLTERSISAIRVEENAEVIKLLLRDFEENASDWLWETDANLELQHVSPRLIQAAGKPPEALHGKFPQVLLGEVGGPERLSNSPVAKLTRFISERSPFRDLIIPVHVHGEQRFWQLTGKPILDKSGEFVGYHGVGSDVTSARRSQEQIAFLAHHDSLTKLPNRVLFNEMLHLGCSRAEDAGLTLLCLDLDDFKSVNDSMGHATGDGLLISVSERIRSCVREGDIAARLGGDEFAIILMTKDMAEVTLVAQRLVERIGRPYHFEGRMIEVGVSIGVSMAPKDGNTPGVLLKNADLALYRAKAEGRGIWRFYDVQMDEVLKDRRSLQNDLRQALARGEFFLEFQPIMELATRRIVGAEALMRWQHPDRGRLSPADFIPMAEGAGLIAPLGAWALRQACAVAAGWPRDLYVAVNLSPLQFRDEGLIGHVDDALAMSGLDPSRLELEITETTVLETSNQTLEALLQLHGRGIRLSMDDFGTGYSSLGYLRRFPFDKIKIDRSFIHDLGQKHDAASITLAIIGLAANMGLAVTAEGVETEGQAQFLQEHGCPLAQGFLFYRPLRAEEMARVLSEATAAARAADPVAE